MFILRELSRNPEKLLVNFKKTGVDPHVFLIQLMKEIDDGNIRPYNPTHLVVHIMSLCVFPFAARPVLQGILFNDDEEQYEEFLEERKETVSRFVINAIRNS